MFVSKYCVKMTASAAFGEKHRDSCPCNYGYDPHDPRDNYHNTMTLAEELAACETRDSAVAISHVAGNSKSSKQANGRNRRKPTQAFNIGSYRPADAQNGEIIGRCTTHDQADPVCAGVGQAVPS